MINFLFESFRVNKEDGFNKYWIHLKNYTDQTFKKNIYQNDWHTIIIAIAQQKKLSSAITNEMNVAPRFPDETLQTGLKCSCCQRNSLPQQCVTHASECFIYVTLGWD